MLLVPHTLVGLVVGVLLKNPFIVAPVAFLSHFVLDIIPHWDFFSGTDNNDGSRTSGWRLFAFIADFGVSLIIGIFFSLRGLWVFNDALLAVSLLTGALFANLPDVLTAPYIFHLGIYSKSSILRGVTSFQRRFQTNVPFFYGILTQLLVVAVCFYLLLR